ncbi:GTA-gp10 family protein [Brevundimonas sp.]|uniref:GTA-gp10 family protein n=1 Tax=Brevundimonas sp. TaxID=1871086 RepID=UPI00257BE2BC|nr:GTA-gp10 family protein [Brevundimonas sp.]
MNQARGEAAVMLGGVRRRVCLPLGALAEIETGLGVEGLAAAAERMKTLSARDLMVVLAAVLRGGGEARPEVEAVDPREAARAVAAAFEASSGQAGR